MPYFKFKKHNIFYRTKRKLRKSSIVLLFIHGSGETSEVWKEQLNSLKINLDLIAIDLPGHGNSEKFSKNSMDLYIKIIKKFQTELKSEHLILAGHSLGGAVAQSFYYRYPDDVGGLILCATGSKLRVNEFILNSLKGDFEAYLKSIPIAAFYRETNQSIKTKYVEKTQELDPDIIYRDFKICDDFDTMDKTTSIHVPTLILVGNADKLTPKKYSLYFKQKIKDAQLKVIGKAGHMVMLEQPKKVNKEIEKFITNLSKNP
ncbi:MAG: alpha/beta hydrolase [Promethearchaeia archaeon]